jgi:hypothetical protein
MMFIEDQSASYAAALAENPYNASPAAGGLLSVGNYEKLWLPGRAIKLRFMEPVSSDYLRAFLRAASNWLLHANLTFEVVTNGYADIRITTDTADDKSLIGTDALTFEQSEATFYLATPMDSESFKSTVIHEMGHALGFIHEHLHRDANIPWNREKVYEFYRDEYEWDKQRVDDNVFTPFNGAVIDTEYDPKSIMHYPVPKELTDGVWEIGQNTELSEQDKKLAEFAYPKDPDDRAWKDFPNVSNAAVI